MTNELKKYNEYLKKEAKKFKLTSEDLSNLYDFCYMLDYDTHQTFKLNKMGKWFKEFFRRIEKIVIPELYENERNR